MTLPGDPLAPRRQLYVGWGRHGPSLAAPGQAVLVLGPPRSGKTTSLVIPNVVRAPGAVVTTSTKPDVMTATSATRSRCGDCWLYDPTGTVAAGPGVRRARWSPVAAAGVWDDALLMARVMVHGARPETGPDSHHWTERAGALIAPLLHAAALSGEDMRSVARWILRQDLGEARSVLAGHAATTPLDVVTGLAATDPREMSGIWSSAAGVLAAYRSDAALASSAAVNFDPADLAGSADTVYICAPAEHQELVAPAIVAFVERARAGAYRRASRLGPEASVAMILDEVANVAPLPDLPAMVSEGGGQGVSTLACLQDLSQARHRWGSRADGFATLFGVKVLLPGIGDRATLELVSRLGGEVDVAVPSVSRGAWYGPGWGAPTATTSVRRQRAITFDQVSQQPPGTGLVLAGPQAPARVWLPPWWRLPGLIPGAERAVGWSEPPRGSLGRDSLTM